MLEPVGDPVAIRAKAAELRAAARAIEDVVSGATSSTRSMFFEGPRGERVRAEIARGRKDAARSFETLIEIAARLESIASVVEEDRAAYVRMMQKPGR